jgi:hypothetical protein
VLVLLYGRKMLGVHSYTFFVIFLYVFLFFKQIK